MNVFPWGQVHPGWAQVEPLRNWEGPEGVWKAEIEKLRRGQNGKEVENSLWKGQVQQEAG